MLPGKKASMAFDQQQNRGQALQELQVTGPQPHLAAAGRESAALAQRRGQDPPGHSHHNGVIEQESNPALLSPAPCFWCSCSEGQAATAAAVIQSGSPTSLLVIDDNQLRAPQPSWKPSVRFELIANLLTNAARCLVTSNQPFREWDIRFFPKWIHDVQRWTGWCTNLPHRVGNQKARSTCQKKLLQRVSSDFR